MTPTRRFLLATPFLASPALTRHAWAQPAWPSRPVKLVIPFPPGGSTDAVGRTIAQAIGAAISQPVVAENRGGAGGQIGVEAVAKAEPDGHTLLVCTSSTAVMGPHLYPKLGYVPLRDLVAVVRAAQTPNAIMVRADLPVADLAGLVALAQARPGQLTYGTPGNGTSGHFTGEYFHHRTGISLQQVPYRGTGPLLADALAGRLDVIHDNLPPFQAAAREGKLRILGVTSPERWYSAPEVPTIAEAAGLPGYEAMIWWGVQAPAGTPPAILARLAEAVTAGFATWPLGQPAFPAFLAADFHRWGEVAKQAGIKLD
jgi:tripartite-type tricarboxylate transporter receptor subunit TctC